jgi:hypothetical protein
MVAIVFLIEMNLVIFNCVFRQFTFWLQAVPIGKIAEQKRNKE